MKEAQQWVQDHAEAIASRFFETLFVGAHMEKLEAVTGRTYDFCLHRSNGPSAVEVTGSLNETVKRTQMQIRRDGFISAHRCKKPWWIQAEPGASIAKIRSKADAYLAHIESYIERFYCATDCRTPAIRRIFNDLRASSGSVISRRHPGICLDLSPAGDHVDAYTAVKAALRAARQPDNKKKLSAAGTNERHLLVYVDPATNYLPWKSLIDFPPPSEAPELPIEITDIWAITETRSQHQYVCWHASSSSSWTRIGPLPLVI